MKNLLLAGIIIVAVSYFLYRKKNSGESSKRKIASHLPEKHFKILDMEGIITWFTGQPVSDFMSADVIAIAINLKKITSTDNTPDGMNSILSELPKGETNYPETILLGFFDKSKASLLPDPNIIIFNADALSPTLAGQFKDKAILILE